MTHVFVSYSHRDAKIAHQIAETLEQFGIKIWIDYAELHVGDSLIERLRNGIDTATHLLAIISANSIKSNWVQKELEIATIKEIEGKKISVLPAVLDDVELPGFLFGKYYADFHLKEQYMLEVAKLVVAIDEDSELINPPQLPNLDTSPYSYSPFFNTYFTASLNNQLGLKIVEIASTYSPSPIMGLMPEHLRRYDEYITYAIDAGDNELYLNNKAEYEKLWKEYAPYHYLLSSQGILMRHAVRFFIESARAGDPEALWNLGWRYELGQGVPEKHSVAIYYWRLAAERGHDPSKKKLSELGLF